MTKSFFGGDPSRAHWSVSVCYKATKDETTKDQRERRDRERAILKSAGIKTQQYFQYQTIDETGKAAMKIKADAEAVRIESITGVKMDVCEGCFL